MTGTAPAWQWYDDNADQYEELDPATVDFGRALVEYADPGSGARLLDVGAGRGPIVRFALDRGCVITAVDAAPAMVARLRNDFPSIAVFKMDAHQLDFADGCFDIVTAGYLLDLLDNPAAALTEMHRVLRPGGMIALSVPGPMPHRDRWQWLVDLAMEFYPTAVRDDASDPAPADIPDLLTSSGFVAAARKEVVFPAPVRDAAAFWDLFNSQLPTAISAGWIDRLPPPAFAEFHRRFLAGAEQMHASGGISFDRHLVLHRAYSSSISSRA
jgi:SAM-dependent methyltransferase